MRQKKFNEIIGREEYLKNMDFRGVDFPGDCRGKKFVNCKMSSTSNVDFTDGKFHNVEFTGLMSDCIFDKTTFYKCDFSTAMMSRCSFIEIDTAYSNFYGAKILECKLNDAEIHSCNFDRAFIRNSNIYDAVIYGTDLISIVAKGFRIYQVGPTGYHGNVMYFPDQDIVICTGIYFSRHTLKEFEEIVPANEQYTAIIEFFKAVKK